MLAFWDVLAGADRCPVFCNPHGPGTPFGSPVLVVCDSLRVLCTLGGLAVLASIPPAIRWAGTAGQRSRLVSFGMFALVVMNTEAVHFGDYPSIRLPLTLAAVAFAAHGMYSIHRHERPAESRRGRC